MVPFGAESRQRVTYRLHGGHGLTCCPRGRPLLIVQLATQVLYIQLVAWFLPVVSAEPNEATNCFGPAEQNHALFRVAILTENTRQSFQGKRQDD